MILQFLGNSCESGHLAVTGFNPELAASEALEEMAFVCTVLAENISRSVINQYEL
jgi:hypothetical protein